ncbi:MAG: type II secretion system F family protein [Thermoplasmata archaeon]|nr:type II secretion system F family protein [Thermoplasmata archaeon]
MALSGYAKLGYKLFRNKARDMAAKNKALNVALEQAHINVQPEVYISIALLNVLIGVIVGLVIAILLNLIVFPALASGPNPIEVPAFIGIILWILPVILPIAAYGLTLNSPHSKLKSRAKDIDKNLPYAVNYMAAMSAANVTPTVIFRGLSRQEIYGEVRKEAALIARDIDMFGKDLLKALHLAMVRCPSSKFQEFLQGIITTSTSGGSLKVYFMTKGDQFMKENRIEQLSTMETLGVMAESFVTVVVAAPLFLLVMMSVMAMMGGEGGAEFLYLIVFIMLPICQFAFIVLLYGM